MILAKKTGIQFGKTQARIDLRMLKILESQRPRHGTSPAFYRETFRSNDRLIQLEAGKRHSPFERNLRMYRPGPIGMIMPERSIQGKGLVQVEIPQGQIQSFEGIFAVP